MLCERCHTPLEEDALFCPECGQRVGPSADDADDVTVALDRIARGNNSGYNANDDFRDLAARLDTMDSDDQGAEPSSADDVPPTGFSSQPQLYEDIYSSAAPAQQPVYPPYSAPYSAPDQPPYGYASPNLNSYGEQPVSGENASPTGGEDFGDGYVTAPAESNGKYQKTSAGKRTASILLCILMAVLLLYTMLNLSLRLTMTEDNIRSAATAEKMVSQTLLLDTGETSAVNYLRSQIGANQMAEYRITDEQLKTFIRKGRLPKLVANLIVDYSDYFLNDKVPTRLNASYIVNELKLINEDLGNTVASPAHAFNTERIAERIKGGDLSFLSIDDEGGYFYRAYGINPKLLATLGSLPILIICAVIAVLCIVMIFTINSSNLPAGMNFCGVVMIVIGSFYMLTAIGCLVLTFIKEFWIVTQLLQTLALWTGVISAALLLIGVVMLIVSGVLKRRAAAADGLLDE